MPACKFCNACWEARLGRFISHEGGREHVRDLIDRSDRAEHDKIAAENEKHECHQCEKRIHVHAIKAGRCPDCFAVWNGSIPTHMRDE